MIKKIKKRIKQSVENNKGSAMMYFIIFMIFFLPFAIWVGIHLPIKYESTYTIKQMVSNTADSIVSRLHEEEIAEGKVWINPNLAKEVAVSMVKETLNVEYVEADKHFIVSDQSVIGSKQIPFHFTEFKDLIDINNDITLEKDGNGTFILPDSKGIYVYILNGLPYGEEVKFKDLTPIENTSVIVRANIPVSTGSLFGGEEGTVIKKTGYSEAFFHVGETP